MQRIDTPWPLTSSFGRALITPALEAWRAVLPRELAGVALSVDGLPAADATAILAATQDIPAPWRLTFAFGRALVAPALLAWRGDPDRAGEAQPRLIEHVHRASAVLDRPSSAETA